MCRRGAWIELTVEVTSSEIDSKQDARIILFLVAGDLEKHWGAFMTISEPPLFYEVAKHG